MKDKEYNLIFRLNQNFLGENKLTIETKNVPIYPLHSHTYYEMAIYFNGKGNLNLNATTYHIDSTTVVLVTPADFHGFSKVDGNLTSIKIAFDETLIPDKSILPTNGIIFKCKEEMHYLKSLFTEILNSANQKKYVSFLISSIILKIKQSGISIVFESNDPKYQKVSKAIKYINNNFCDGISLTNIAENLNITPEYLSKIFKEIIGISFAEYLIKLRLDYSTELLANKTLNVTEISLLCGYQNVSHFFRSFKRAFGITPNLYRKQIIANE